MRCPDCRTEFALPDTPPPADDPAPRRRAAGQGPVSAGDGDRVGGRVARTGLRPVRWPLAVLLVALVALLGGVVGLVLTRSPRGGHDPDGPAVATLPADALFAAYADDPAAGDSKYTGRVVRVTGTVERLDPVPGGYEVVLYDGPRGDGGRKACRVEVAFDRDQVGLVARLRPKEPGTVTARCGGRVELGAADGYAVRLTGLDVAPPPPPAPVTRPTPVLPALPPAVPSPAPPADPNRPAATPPAGPPPPPPGPPAGALEEAIPEALELAEEQVRQDRTLTYARLSRFDRKEADKQVRALSGMGALDALYSDAPAALTRLGLSQTAEALIAEGVLKDRKCRPILHLGWEKVPAVRSPRGLFATAARFASLDPRRDGGALFLAQELAKAGPVNLDAPGSEGARRVLETVLGVTADKLR